MTNLGLGLVCFCAGSLAMYGYRNLEVRVLRTIADHWRKKFVEIAADPLPQAILNDRLEKERRGMKKLMADLISEPSR